MILAQNIQAQEMESGDLTVAAIAPTKNAWSTPHLPTSNDRMIIDEDEAYARQLQHQFALGHPSETQDDIEVLERTELADDQKPAAIPLRRSMTEPPAVATAAETEPPPSMLRMKRARKLVYEKQKDASDDDSLHPVWDQEYEGLTGGGDFSGQFRAMSRDSIDMSQNTVEFERGCEKKIKRHLKF